MNTQDSSKATEPPDIDAIAAALNEQDVISYINAKRLIAEVRRLREEVRVVRACNSDAERQVDDVLKNAGRIRREAFEEAAKVVGTLLAHIDEMPNPHSDPMRHYYNQMRVWKDDARAAIRKLAEGEG